MADGGFLLKFDGKEIDHCYSVAFDHDFWQYKVNNEAPKPFPQGIKKIEVIFEDAPAP